MTVTDVKKLTEDKAKKRLNELIDLNDYLDEWKTSSLLCFLHKGICTRGNHGDSQEEWQVWQEYRAMIKPLVVWMKRMRDSEKEKSQLTKTLRY